MKLEIPSWIHRRLLRLGVDLVGANHWNHPVLRRLRLLRDHRIDVVLDVGANAGQYGTELRELGFGGRIVSFEPLSDAFAKLRKAAEGDARWECVRTAVGERAGTATIHVAANSYSSSLLPMLAAHEAAAPGSGYVGTEEVPMEPLEALLARHVRPDERVYLKIDTQGYERKVLESAGAALGRIAGVQLELSIVPLYEGVELLPEMLLWLRSLGFTLVSLEPGYADPASGQLLQVDGVLFRSAQAGAGARAPK
jgi:FkbM family methyltransferase